MKSDSERKKLAIFGGLAVLLVAAVGYQFLAGGQPAPAPKATAKRERKSAPSPEIAMRTGPPGPQDVRVAQQSPEALPPAGNVDIPVAPPTAPPQAVVAPPDATAVAPAAPPADRPPLRDPFAGGPHRIAPTPPTPPPAPSTSTAPTPPRANRPPRVSDFQPSAMTPPMSLPGDVLPQATPNPSTPPNPGGEAPGVQVEAGKPLRQPGEPPYSVVGIVLGKRPVAVLQDDEGRQATYTVGSSLDGRGKILKIERGRVVVRYSGQNATLTFGGTP